MARRKDVNSQDNTAMREISIDGGLLSRIEKISKQTGLDTSNLFQKWVLQEESLIGLIRRGKDQAAAQTEIPPDVFPRQNPDVRKRKKEKLTETGSAGSDYRKTLVKRAAKLRKEGMTLVKIAEVFNEEKLATLSGKGKWYSSSIIWLLNEE